MVINWDYQRNNLLYFYWNFARMKMYNWMNDCKNVKRLSVLMFKKKKTYLVRLFADITILRCDKYWNVHHYIYYSTTDILLVFCQLVPLLMVYPGQSRNIQRTRHVLRKSVGTSFVRRKRSVEKPKKLFDEILLGACESKSKTVEPQVSRNNSTSTDMASCFCSTGLLPR